MWIFPIPHKAELNFIGSENPDFLALTLLVLGIFADNAQYALTLDKLALVADRLY